MLKKMIRQENIEVGSFLVADFLKKGSNQYAQPTIGSHWCLTVNVGHVELYEIQILILKR